ncbi:3-oxoacyl-[acyl-carrier-protein] synthase III [Malonomonas rubra DSM 5091]|uniref:Beta-ketoacyl-[acyl-carrier-protein] synthase III n=1 Tax=Malonomonas rubra DSM 5091 TaxID=1122189 RepID=A0A1M6DDY2_MALRU|nr:beta-ketoacyl-ACP synthase III [Malonomonas rubra]SHI71494.1 3-oxoacyl-[acyl-carrier-protein] synthase III [Malonomonas rubra DSM 5091]
MKSRVIGTGSYAPEKVLTNYDLEKMVETNHDWIVARTGIEERRIAADDEFTSDLATKAAQRALEMAGVAADEIDVIVLATITGDYPWPATACIVQNNIGAKNAYAYDVSAACSGFLYALASADDFLMAGRGKKALVIGAELFSRSCIDWTDRNTCVLFGDGAGAVVLEAQESESGVLSSHLYTDGSYLELLYQPGFGVRHQASQEGIEAKLPFLKMQGNEVFKHAVRMMTEVSKEALKHNGYTSKDVGQFIPHQANIRILEATVKRLKLTEEQSFINVNKYGNTSAATIPIAIDEANRGGKLKEGDLALLTAFGGGFTWGGTLLRW